MYHRFQNLVYQNKVLNNDEKSNHHFATILPRQRISSFQQNDEGALKIHGVGGIIPSVAAIANHDQSKRKMSDLSMGSNNLSTNSSLSSYAFNGQINNHLYIQVPFGHLEAFNELGGSDVQEIEEDYQVWVKKEVILEKKK